MSIPVRARTDIAAFVADAARTLSLPGLALGVLRAGQDPELFGRSRPATARYQVGSLSKLVTACTVLALRDDGRLRLSDPVAVHLPWFAGPGGPRAGVTVADLMLHRGGLPRGGLVTTNPSPAEVRAAVGAAPSLAAPTAVATYSNLGYTVLGAVIEAVTGSPFAEVATRRVLAPLGLSASGFGPPDSHLLPPHQLSCFGPDGTGLFEVEPMPLVGSPHAAMGLISSVPDVLALAGSLVPAAGGPAALAPGSVAELLSLRAPRTEGPDLGPGFNHLDAFGGPLVFETAEHFGHGAALLVHPQARTVVVAMSNRASAGADLWTVVGTVARSLLGPAPQPPPALRHPRPDRVVGTYTAGDGATVTVTSSGDRLMVLGDGVRSELVYRGQGTFHSGGSLARHAIRAEVATDGRVRSLVAGPRRYRREAAGGTPGPDRHGPLAGTYHHPVVGRLAVFGREHELVLAFTPFKEARLAPAAEDAFVQLDGPFRGEPVVFDRTTEELAVGGLTYARTASG